MTYSTMCQRVVQGGAHVWSRVGYRCNLGWVASVVQSGGLELFTRYYIIYSTQSLLHISTSLGAAKASIAKLMFAWSAATSNTSYFQLRMLARDYVRRISVGLFAVGCSGVSNSECLYLPIEFDIRLTQSWLLSHFRSDMYTLIQAQCTLHFGS